MDTKNQFTLSVLLFVVINGTAAANFKEGYEKGPPDRHKEEPEFCVRGQHLDAESGVCKPCPSDHYMPDALHAQARCYPCHHARPDSAEIDLVACTDTLDTTIGCKSGWFLRESVDYYLHPITCHPCTQCNDTNPPSYEIRQCGTFTDTVCCPYPNMLAVERDGEQAYVCQDQSLSLVESNAFLDDRKHTNSSKQQIDDVMHKEATTKAVLKDDVKNLSSCGPDHFLNINDGNKTGGCEKCPDGWYRPESRHTNVNCLPRPKTRRLDNENFSQPITHSFFIGIAIILFVFTTLTTILAIICYQSKNRENGYDAHHTNSFKQILLFNFWRKRRIHESLGGNDKCKALIQV